MQEAHRLDEKSELTSTTEILPFAALLAIAGCSVVVNRVNGTVSWVNGAACTTSCGDVEVLALEPLFDWTLAALPPLESVVAASVLRARVAGLPRSLKIAGGTSNCTGGVLAEGTWK